MVDGNPQIILFDIGSGAWQLDSYKQELWNTCSIGIPHLDVEANDAVILGFMVAQLIGEVGRRFLFYLYSLFSETAGPNRKKKFFPTVRIENIIL